MLERSDCLIYATGLVIVSSGELSVVHDHVVFVQVCKVISNGNVTIVTGVVFCITRARVCVSAKKIYIAHPGRLKSDVGPQSEIFEGRRSNLCSIVPVTLPASPLKLCRCFRTRFAIALDLCRYWKQNKKQKKMWIYFPIEISSQTFHV